MFWGVLWKKVLLSVGFPCSSSLLTPDGFFLSHRGYVPTCTWYITLLLSHSEKDLSVQSVSEI